MEVDSGGLDIDALVWTHGLMWRNQRRSEDNETSRYLTDFGMREVTNGARIASGKQETS